MRNFTLISILLALVAGGVVWQKVMHKNSPGHLLEPVEYIQSPANHSQADGFTEACIDDSGEVTSDCTVSEDSATAEQGEMAEQRTRSHDVMIDSFNQKADRYKGHINNQQ